MVGFRVPSSESREGTGEREALVAPARREETPLPKLQLVILCAVRLAEPIAYAQIFPYVNRMVGLIQAMNQSSPIGFYSGLVESVFGLAELLFILQWAKLSDRIGRKPVVLYVLLGSAVGTLLFGLSTMLSQALAARMFAGALAGNTAVRVIRSMIGEITNEPNHARAFPILSLCWSLGCIIGPLIGGGLSEPASRYPEIFGRIQLLRDHPFFLPCAVSSSLTLISITNGYFFIKETIPSRVRKQSQLDGKSIPNYGSVGTSMIVPPPPKSSPPPTMLGLLSDRTIVSVVRTYFILAINGGSIDVLFALLAYTAIPLGGLARNPAEIGLALSLSGLIASIMSPILFPWLVKRVPIKRLYPVLMSLYPISFITLPFLNRVARANRVPGSDTELTSLGTVLLWTAIAVPVFMSRIAGMSYAANMIFLKHASPSKEMLGSTLGIGQSVASISRGIAPAMSSSLFAASIEHNLLGGWLVWIVMASIGLVGVVFARNIQDGVEERIRAAQE